ncbi:MAG: M20/M25/M40 family metallo-hydrolase, partial [Candidatus Lokiarchaeota archaeon]|nr:M20/M25/M40 family metallo-hydrolase [Candidatus Lokiarchaeota archaeon]MBD3212313.1 M20/M25/M40 family metallo-hydrolase [Candidatus Lokiarchaeota archaeon]
EFLAPTPEKLRFYKIKVEGLLGGHSGGDIHLPRANANKMIARLMTVLNKNIDIFISEWNSGSNANVIPRSSQMIFGINPIDESKLKQMFRNEKEAIYRYYLNEMKILEPNMSIFIEDVENRKVFGKKESTNIIATANLIPNGVINVSPLYEDFIHTSCNFGVIKTNENEIEFQSYPRSIWRTELNVLVNRFDQLAKFNRWEIELRPILPEWSPKPNSQFIQFVKKQYEQVVNQEIKLHLVHGGLETGMISNKLPRVSMVSLGPTVEDNHSPNERLKIEDVGILYQVLKNIVMNINKIKN